MPLVRGSDAYTVVHVAENAVGATWGATPSFTFSGGVRQHRMATPIVSESMTTVRDFFPKSKEFGETGALAFEEYGRAHVEGDLVIQPRYNQQWFGVLMAHVMGQEIKFDDIDVDGTTTFGSNLGNLHYYEASATLPAGFAMEIWKVNSTGTPAGYVHTFLGCVISKMVWEQPEGDLPRITLSILAKNETVVIYSSVTHGAAPRVVGLTNDTGTANSPVFIAARDLSTGARAKIQTGSPLAALNATGFTLTYDKHLTFENAWANDPDNQEKPGANENRDVLFEVRGVLEETFGNSAKPYGEFIAKTASKARIQYASTSFVTGSASYTWGLDIPNLVWEEARGPLAEQGAPPTQFKGRGVLGTFATPSATGALASITPTGDFRMWSLNKPAEDADASWSNL